MTTATGGTNPYEFDSTADPTVFTVRDATDAVFTSPKVKFMMTQAEIKLFHELSDYVSGLGTLVKHGALDFPEIAEEELKQMIGKIVATRFEAGKERDAKKLDVEQMKNEEFNEHLRQQVRLEANKAYMVATKA